jgi:hypothetical protein
VILIPTFKRIKEWAYAGLFFDLVGATYSADCKGRFSNTNAIYGSSTEFSFYILFSLAQTQQDGRGKVNHVMLG